MGVYEAPNCAADMSRPAQPHPISSSPNDPMLRPSMHVAPRRRTQPHQQQARAPLRRFGATPLPVGFVPPVAPIWAIRLRLGRDVSTGYWIRLLNTCGCQYVRYTSGMDEDDATRGHVSRSSAGVQLRNHWPRLHPPQQTLPLGLGSRSRSRRRWLCERCEARSVPIGCTPPPLLGRGGGQPARQPPRCVASRATHELGGVEPPETKSNRPSHEFFFFCQKKRRKEEEEEETSPPCTVLGWAGRVLCHHRQNLGPTLLHVPLLVMRQ